MADALDVLPGFGDDAGRLEENGGDAEGRIDADGEVRLEAKTLAEEAVTLLDAAFGIKTIGAHVPLADGTVGARLWIGTADDADNEVAGLERAAARRFADTPERFVADDQ